MIFASKPNIKNLFYLKTWRLHFIQMSKGILVIPVRYLAQPTCINCIMPGTYQHLFAANVHLQVLDIFGYIFLVVVIHQSWYNQWKMCQKLWWLFFALSKCPFKKTAKYLSQVSPSILPAANVSLGKVNWESPNTPNVASRKEGMIFFRGFGGWRMWPGFFGAKWV